VFDCSLRVGRGHGKICEGARWAHSTTPGGRLLCSTAALAGAIVGYGHMDVGIIMGRREDIGVVVVLRGASRSPVSMAGPACGVGDL
jgi:hypothetical protein